MGINDGYDIIKLNGVVLLDFYRNLNKLLVHPGCIVFKSVFENEAYEDIVHLDNCSLGIEIKYQPHTQVNKSLGTLRRVLDDKVTEISLLVANPDHMERDKCLRKLENITGVKLN